MQVSQLKTDKNTRRRTKETRCTLSFSERQAVLLLMDTLITNISVFTALWGWQAVDHRPFQWAFVSSHWHWFPLLSMSWLSLAWLFDLYDGTKITPHLEISKRLLSAMTVLVAGYLLMYYLAPPDTLPRILVLMFAGIASPVLVFWRWAYTTIFVLSHMQRRVLVVGGGWAGETLVALVNSLPHSIYRVVGVVDDDISKQRVTIAGCPVVGTGDQLMDLVATLDVDQIVLAITEGVRTELFQALVDCKGKGIEVMRMPDFYSDLTRCVPVEHVTMDWVLEAIDDTSVQKRAEQLLRRIMDFMLGAIGALLLALLLPFIALAIRLDDNGPVFYAQTRSGKGQQPFQVIKFRTMRTDAEKNGKPQWAVEGDSRVTRVGRILRKTRIDELPQVLNVLRGDMSIVGPRPERPEFITKLEQQIPFYRTRLIVRPGITGWAQVSFGYGNTVEDTLRKLEYDLYYIKHRSLWLDIYTICRTVGVIFRMEGT